MKQKLKFIKMAWKMLVGKDAQWVFFKLTKENQADLINGKGAEFRISYVGVDSRAIEKIAEKINS